MKLKLKFLLSLIIAVFIYTGVCALALNTGDIAITKKDGFTTKITDKSGAEYILQGVIDAAKIEQSECGN